ncbi:hypothetical protein RJT34_08334 [Clitoria ternatea]|uniref:Protein BIG GRAIN 1-like B n=1 Tax=Clitoria ternatea TaxID=43366 RepID=A0AAN9PUI4_CLITE
MVNMYKIDNDRFISPTFSSSLLDQIYRSIEDGERKSTETNFYRHTTTMDRDCTKKQSRTKSNIFEWKKNTKLLDPDQDVLFFSSTSISSSDSSYGGFSSSDTESISRASCYEPPRPNSLRTCASFRSEKQGTRVFDGGKTITVRDEELLIKSKSRALKIYNNLKKVKQPISPGGRITSFLNSLFANTKKTNRSTCEENTRKVKSVRASSSTCSSARSCLSKTSSCERERMCNGVKRTVRFYPVSVIVGEDCKPCGHKRLYEEQEGSREFLKDYRNRDLVLKNELSLRTKVNNERDDSDDDDASSYASSDLFELDHLAMFGSARYCEELPVYETTRVSTNRAIASGLIV